MLLAVCKSVEKVEMAGKVTKLMESTSSKEPKEAEVKMVNSCMFKSPVIFLIESAENEDREVALKMVKEPSISLTPVSYTHLDVYKRQAYFLAISQFPQTFRDLVLTQISM